MLELPSGTGNTKASGLRSSAERSDRRADLDPYWKARLAFEGQRRRDIDVLVRDLNTGLRSLHRVVPKGDCGGCGDTEMCWKGSCAAEVTLRFPDGVTDVTCSLVAVLDAEGTELNVLVDTAQASDTTARDAAIAAATDFASTFDAELSILGLSGHTGDHLDRDGDGRMTLVFTNETGGDAISMENVGFFSPWDFLPATDAQATGNEADLLWARVPGTGTITQALAVGTLAHEYAHLAGYAVRVQAHGSNALRETLWLDEALAHTMEDLTGWGASNVRTAEAALDAWADGPFAGPQDSVAQRGRAYLLLRHMIDTEARSRGAEHAGDAATRQAATDVVSTLLNEQKLGFEHQLFVSLGVDGAWQWLLGTYATCNPAIATDGAAHAFDFLPIAEVEANGNFIGINPRGTYTDARGGTVRLQGPRSEELTETDVDFDGEIYLSGSVLFELTGIDAADVGVDPDDDTVTIHKKEQQLR